MYQDVISLAVCFPITRSPSVFMNVMMWEHSTLNNKIFVVAKFSTLTTLSLLLSCKLSFLTVGLKISSLLLSQ
jgi:hypothetical protein